MSYDENASTRYILHCLNELPTGTGYRKRRRYCGSDFLFHIEIYFSQLFKEPWRMIKWQALHIHRARAPTVKII
ncbi:hypothetical protein A4R26_27580 [Niastella populi]|uniref:Uncharacterized protein n=1 Tax=Niastella populi TaxID=550983 RepID=A0A1V9F7Q0_9BACT|nr:hypothetical protein A4R26_27580 [Niastella populi]